MAETTTVMPARVYFEGPFQGIGCKSAEIRDGDRNLLAEVHGQTDDEAMQRAREFVVRYIAYPDMLEALRGLFEAVGRHCYPGCECGKCFRIATARTAIAKAKGK